MSDLIVIEDPKVKAVISKMEPFLPMIPASEYEAGYLAAARLWHRLLTEGE